MLTSLEREAWNGFFIACDLTPESIQHTVQRHKSARRSKNVFVGSFLTSAILLQVLNDKSPLTPSRVGTDDTISGAKLEPLKSNEKEGVDHAASEGGVAGTDFDIDQSRIDPLGGTGK
jgi:hypothetical protein